MKSGYGTFFWLLARYRSYGLSPSDAPLVLQGLRGPTCCLAACDFPSDISDSMSLLVTLVHWLHIRKLIYESNA